ncbi:executer 1 [Ranunculus cassubicifolius]
MASSSLSSPSFASPSTYNNPNPYKLQIKSHKLTTSLSRPPLKSFLLSPPPPRVRVLRCQNNNNPDPQLSSNNDDDDDEEEESFNGRLDSLLHQAMKNVTKSFDDFVKFYRNPMNEGLSEEIELVAEDYKEVEDWDWDRWMNFIKELEDQEKIVSVLKAKLGEAVRREDYKEAANLKVGIAAAAANDTVGRVIAQLNKAVEEERYNDAAFIRDNAGAGLVGWWAGVSEGSDDPYGRIIRINAEHGRYVARNFSPRQLATATPGAPLFEIFVTTNDEGEYRQLVVYLKRNRGKPVDSLTKSSKLSDLGGGLSPLPGLTNLSTGNTDDLENSEDIDDSDLVEGLAGLIPDAKVKLLKVTGPGKVDKGPVTNVVDQISDEEDEEEESIDLNTPEKDDTDADSRKKTPDEIVMDSAGGINDNSDIVVKIVFGGLLQKISNQVPSKDLVRVPATIEKKGRLSFSFSINTSEDEVEAENKPPKRRRSAEIIMKDMAKIVAKQEKIPRKVLKDVGELIKFSLSQAQNRQTLSGSTTFNRIEVAESPDPLNGLYIGAHGMYTSEVIHLRRNFGQWREEDDGNENKKSSQELEFYEYVEALKLTGDPYVPAGQVAFRAKIGKHYQLPHKGIFPEELGVVARYKGQGRLADTGFSNPRWVDGELVIINSKYIKGGPVVGFVYWAPESHFLVFFNRLRLQS